MTPREHLLKMLNTLSEREEIADYEEEDLKDVDDGATGGDEVGFYFRLESDPHTMYCLKARTQTHNTR